MKNHWLMMFVGALLVSSAYAQDRGRDSSVTQKQALQVVGKALEAQKQAIAALRAALNAIKASTPEGWNAAIDISNSASAMASSVEKEANELMAATKAESVTALPAVAQSTREDDRSGLASSSTSTTTNEFGQSDDPSANKRWQVKAGQGAGAASLTLSVDSDSGVISSNGQKRYGSYFNEVTLSAPISKSTDTTSLGTLDGLANAASVELSHREFIKRSDPYSLLSMWGIAGKLASQQFTYYQAGDLQKKTITKAPDSFSFFYAKQLAEPTILFGKVEYQSIYKDANSKIACPFATSTLYCVSGPIGEPGHSTARVLKFGLHHLGTFGQFDVAPVISYDRAAKVTGIDVPIYLWGSGDAEKPAGLSGGFDVSWRNDTQQTLFSVFVGTPLSFWSF